jgi:nicotinate-nucleotide adenylyltransferase
VARVGILGGTFNPPHIGHLAVARAALEQLQLARVALVPARTPPHKAIECEPGPEHRYEMCRLTAAAGERIEVSRVELDREGPSYTVDTLRLLHEQAPDAELTLIVGSDMAVDLPTWRDPEGILGLASLAVAARAGAERETVRRRLAALRGAERVAFLDMEEVDVSSSLVRERVARGLEIDDLVADGVAEYIQDHGLYRTLEPIEAPEVHA